MQLRNSSRSRFWTFAPATMLVKPSAAVVPMPDAPQAGRRPLSV
ncbi:UNVERIFIED_CONTAM: hypothetical protein GTU68_065484 [Idotea baltica]|nr:hypothetical protein [Idotea baltica]